MTVIKRDGQKVSFDRQKIFNAVSKAFIEVDRLHYLDKEVEACNAICDDVENWCKGLARVVYVEEIQDRVEAGLMRLGEYDVARAYIRYRYRQSIARDKYEDLMKAVEERIQAKDVQNQNANVDERSFGGRAGEVQRLIMKQYALDYCMSEMARNNHLNNEIYTHDLDAYAVGCHNCLTVPFDKLLANGFNTRQTDVRPANSLNTAMQLTAVLFQLQSLSQFGGVSAGHYDWTMVPYVRKSFAKHYLEGMRYLDGETDDVISMVKARLETNNPSIESTIHYDTNSRVYRYAMDKTHKECHQAVEALIHNLK